MNIYSIIAMLLIVSTTAAQAVQFPPGTAVETNSSQVEVTIDPKTPLSIGNHTFELTVIDASGNKSVPVRAQVAVVDATPPTAVLKTPGRVSVGQSFVLDGSGSQDPNGKIVKYVWRLID